MGGGNGLGHPAGVVHVVVLQNNHVEQPVAVVHAAADEHGPFLANAEVRRGFAGVEQLGLGAGQQGVQVGRVGRNAAHALHAVEHEALGRQDAARGALNGKGDVAVFHSGAIGEQRMELQAGVDFGENEGRQRHTGQNAFAFHQQVGPVAGIGRNGGKGRMVAVAHVLGQGRADEAGQRFGRKIGGGGGLHAAKVRPVRR